MHITKCRGLGNDYIYLNCLETVPEGPAGAGGAAVPPALRGGGATASSPSGPA